MPLGFQTFVYVVRHLYSPPLDMPFGFAARPSGTS